MTTILGLSGPGGGALVTAKGYGLLLSSVYYIPVFPRPDTLPGQTYPVIKEQVWSNLRQVAVSGKKTTIGLFTFPDYKYTLTYSALRTLTYQELQLLIDFINDLGGGTAPFYFDDPDDDLAVDQEMGIGDGVTTVFPLRRQLLLGGFAEPIQAPVPETLAIKIDGVATTAFSLGNAGVVTFDSALAAGALATWSGSYYWLCRFDEDVTQYRKNLSWIWDLQKLSFSTEKL